MFIKASAFKKLIKNAWSKEGLTIGAADGELFLAGGYWVIRVDREEIPNKIKAAIIELTGELPTEGQVFTSRKGEDNQYEIAENGYWEITERFKEAKIPLEVTQLKIESVTRNIRVLKLPDTGCVLVHDFYMELIDYSEVEEMEGKPEGPVTTGPVTGMLYWQNEIMTIAVDRIDPGYPGDEIYDLTEALGILKLPEYKMK